jgi:hypothetical protein
LTLFLVFHERGSVYAAQSSPQDWSGIPVTDFRLTVEEVLRDDGTIASGEPIILRAWGFSTQETHEATKDSEYPLSYTGDRHLFLLGRNPDGTYGISYGTWSRLIIDGESLRISNGKGDPLRFKENDKAITLEEFRAAIRKANADVSSTPGTDPAVTNTTK